MESRAWNRWLAILWLLVQVSGMLNAQICPKEQVYRAYIYDRMDDWGRVIGELGNRKATLSDAQLVELVNYYYGYIAWAIGQGMTHEAGQYLLDAEDLVAELLAKHPEIPELYAYRGALIAYDIALNRIKLVVLGPESKKYIDRAIEIGPESPQGWIEKGNSLFYIPKMFGGSKKKAIEAYHKAIQLMEKEPGATSRNWLYLNVLLQLGQCYEKTGNFHLAKITYEKVLCIEPGFVFMRDDLYPSFLESGKGIKHFEFKYSCLLKKVLDGG